MMMAFMSRSHEFTEIVGHDQSAKQENQSWKRNKEFREAKKNE
jgi:hypothetical protein